MGFKSTFPSIQDGHPAMFFSDENRASMQSPCESFQFDMRKLHPNSLGHIRTDCGEFEGIVGSSELLQEALDLVRTVASTDSTVLVLGETGTHAAGAHSSSSIALLFPLTCSRANYSATKEVLLRVPSLRKLAGSR
jgi:hypothetical protein